jgi:hypothetical protein
MSLVMIAPLRRSGKCLKTVGMRASDAKSPAAPLKKS